MQITQAHGHRRGWFNSAVSQELLTQWEQELEAVLTHIENVPRTESNAKDALRLFERVGRETRVVMGLASSERSSTTDWDCA